MMGDAQKAKMDLRDPIKFLHIDEQFVVVSKVSGFLSVPGRGPEKRDSVSERVKQAFDGCIEQPAVHRLDMDTSGLLVVARTKEAHSALSRQFQERQTEKEYLAVLDGELPNQPASGMIELPFRLDVENRPHQIYDPIHGKLGLTHWYQLATAAGTTRVLFKPITGRTHQLRVHAAHEKGLGIPIVGDPLYGRGERPGDLQLHAAKLSFYHPVSGKKLCFSQPAPF